MVVDIPEEKRLEIKGSTKGTRLMLTIPEQLELEQLELRIAGEEWPRGASNCAETSCSWEAVPPGVHTLAYQVVGDSPRTMAVNLGSTMMRMALASPGR